MSRKWWNSFKELFVLVCFLAGMLQLRTFSYWIADWFSFLWDQLGTPLEQLLICGVPTKKGSPQTLQGAICQELWTKKVFFFCCCMFFLRHTRSNKIHSCLEHHLENIILSTTQRVVSIRLTHMLLFQMAGLQKSSYSYLIKYWS